jgi:hypothetical protein
MRPTRVGCRSARRRTHVAVCSLEFECVQNALLNVGYERPWSVPPLAVVDRIIGNQLHVEAVVDLRRLRERP